MGRKRRSSFAGGGRGVKKGRMSPSGALDSDITLCSTEQQRSYLKDMADYYQQGLYCDAELVCADGGVVLCHRLVLSSISAFLTRCLQVDCSDERSRVSVPDHSHQDVKCLLDGIYGCLGDKVWATSTEILQHQAVLDTLQVDFVPWSSLDPHILLDEDMEEHQTRKFEEEEEMPPSPLGMDPDSDVEDVEEKRVLQLKQEPWVEDEKPSLTAVHRESISAAVAELEEQMKICHGDVIVTIRKKTELPKLAELRRDVAFLAALGLKESDGGVLLASPLAWSPGPTSNLSAGEYFSQYKKYTNALKSVFGLSEAEVHYDHMSRRDMGFVGKQYRVRTTKYRRDMATFTDEELANVVNETRASKVFERGDPKPAFSERVLAARGEVTALKLTSDLHDFDGVLLLSLRADGRRRGLCLKLNDDEERSRNISVMAQALFAMWKLRALKRHIPKCMRYMDMYVPLVTVIVRHNIAKSFLEDADRSLREQHIAEEQCPTCGLAFTLASEKDRQRLVTHRLQHKYLDYKCDCEGDFRSNPTALMKHVKVVHMGFLKCELCAFVFPKGTTKTSARFSKHMASFHEERTCEYCGAKLSHDGSLREHMFRLHPEVGLVRKRKDVLERGGTCDICHETFRDVLKHKKSIHAVRNVLCPLCGKAFANQGRLNGHLKLSHGETDRMSVCPHCQKEFSSRGQFKNHYLGVHMKLMHCLCRYEGCDNKYSDSGSRANHERITHGHTYFGAAKLGLVPKEPKKNFSEDYYRVWKELDGLFADSLQQKREGTEK